jgi:hypothetical protein
MDFEVVAANFPESSRRSGNADMTTLSVSKAQSITKSTLRLLLNLVDLALPAGVLGKEGQTVYHVSIRVPQSSLLR